MKSVLARIGVFGGVIVLLLVGLAAPASASWYGTVISVTPINAGCLDVPDRHPGISLYDMSCDNTVYQLWDVAAVVGDASSFQIINEATHFCLTRSSEDTAAHMYDYFCTTDQNQKWKVLPVSPAPGYKLMSAGNTSLCLKSNGFALDPTMAPCPATKWIFIS